MDALRRQASKLKDQVAKQQQKIKVKKSQSLVLFLESEGIIGSVSYFGTPLFCLQSRHEMAVLKQLGGTGYEKSDVVVIDESEMQRHQQLEKLYISTRGGRDFQKEIIRSGEAFIAMGYKHVEAGTKLSDDCCHYGAENINENILAKAASIYGDARKHVEKEQEDFIRLLSSQILDPLRAMVTGAPLEDGRHLAQRYSRMRQDAETQVAEISRRRSRVKEIPTPENVSKLKASEAKMQEIKSNMAILGKEAAAALAAVEAQQQRLTFQRLVAMVEGEKTFYLRAAAILREIETELVTEKQQKDSAPPIISPESGSEKTAYFLAEAVHTFNAGTEKELSLSVGDYVVVRKVSSTGWSEGECRGKAGWFPSSYVESRQRLPDTNGAAETY